MRRRGQSSLEYALVLSVIGIAVVVAAIVFTPALKTKLVGSRGPFWIDWSLPMGDGQLH